MLTEFQGPRDSPLFPTFPNPSNAYTHQKKKKKKKERERETEEYTKFI